jgi:hypothetical protein
MMCQILIEGYKSSVLQMVWIEGFLKEIYYTDIVQYFL